MLPLLHTAGDLAEAEFGQFSFRKIASVFPHDSQRCVAEQRNHRFQNGLAAESQVGMQYDRWGGTDLPTLSVQDGIFRKSPTGAGRSF
jgi:hypothetical protein